MRRPAKGDFDMRPYVEISTSDDLFTDREPNLCDYYNNLPEEDKNDIARTSMRLRVNTEIDGRLEFKQNITYNDPMQCYYGSDDTTGFNITKFTINEKRFELFLDVLETQYQSREKVFSEEIAYVKNYYNLSRYLNEEDK